MRQLETEEHSISIRNLYRVRIVLLFHLFYSLTIHQYHNIVNQASGIRLGKEDTEICQADETANRYYEVLTEVPLLKVS